SISGRLAGSKGRGILATPDAAHVEQVVQCYHGGHGNNPRILYVNTVFRRVRPRSSRGHRQARIGLWVLSLDRAGPGSRGEKKNGEAGHSEKWPMKPGHFHLLALSR